MTLLQTLRDHLANLNVLDREAMNAGDWARADYLGNCIDDTRDQIRAIERDEALKVINANV